MFSQSQSQIVSQRLLHYFIPLPYGPRLLDPDLSKNTPFEPVPVRVVKKYLVAVQAWHIAQGWPPPLSDGDHNRISWSLRGLENMQGNRKRPVCPSHNH